MNLLDHNEVYYLIDILITRGYEDEINWSRNIKPCNNPALFAHEAVWVILNSGMKNQISKIIWDRILEAWGVGKTTSTAFGHNGKVKAIDYIMANQITLFNEYESATNKIEWLKGLPWIGEITCWHLAKNLGHDVVKPDRHLVRVAGSYNTTPDDLCGQISNMTGERKHTIDLIIWRACNLGIIKV
jgi:hypothetical protein